MIHTLDQETPEREFSLEITYTLSARRKVKTRNYVYSTDDEGNIIPASVEYYSNFAQQDLEESFYSPQEIFDKLYKELTIKKGNASMAFNAARRAKKGNLMAKAQLTMQECDKLLRSIDFTRQELDVSYSM